MDAWPPYEGGLKKKCLKNEKSAAAQERRTTITSAGAIIEKTTTTHVMSRFKFGRERSRYERRTSSRSVCRGSIDRVRLTPRAQHARTKFTNDCVSRGSAAVAKHPLPSRRLQQSHGGRTSDRYGVAHASRRRRLVSFHSPPLPSSPPPSSRVFPPRVVKTLVNLCELVCVCVKVCVRARTSERKRSATAAAGKHGRKILVCTSAGSGEGKKKEEEERQSHNNYYYYTHYTLPPPPRPFLLLFIKYRPTSILHVAPCFRIYRKRYCTQTTHAHELLPRFRRPVSRVRFETIRD